MRVLASMAAILDAMPELEEFSDLTSDGGSILVAMDCPLPAGFTPHGFVHHAAHLRTARVSFWPILRRTGPSVCSRPDDLLPPKRASIAGNLPSCVLRRFRLSTLTSSAMPSSTSWGRCHGAHGIPTAGWSRLLLRSARFCASFGLRSCVRKDSLKRASEVDSYSDAESSSENSQNHRPTDSQGLKGRPRVSVLDLIDVTKLYVERRCLRRRISKESTTIQSLLAELLIFALTRSAPCVLWIRQKRRIFDEEALSFANWSRFLKPTTTFCASETVSCTDKVCLSFGKTGLVLAAEVLRGILRIRR